MFHYRGLAQAHLLMGKAKEYPKTLATFLMYRLQCCNTYQVSCCLQVLELSHSDSDSIFDSVNVAVRNILHISALFLTVKPIVDVWIMAVNLDLSQMSLWDLILITLYSHFCQAPQSHHLEKHLCSMLSCRLRPLWGWQSFLSSCKEC